MQFDIENESTVVNNSGPLHIDGRTGTVTVTLSAREAEAIRYALDDAVEDEDGHIKIHPASSPRDRAIASAHYKFRGIETFLTGCGAPHFEEN